MKRGLKQLQCMPFNSDVRCHLSVPSVIQLLAAMEGSGTSIIIFIFYPFFSQTTIFETYTKATISPRQPPFLAFMLEFMPEQVI